MKQSNLLSKQIKILFLLGIIIFIVLRSKINFPYTLEEIKESYTALSIIHTGRDTNNELPGFFFRTNNDYVSTLGVYLRIPSIYLFGLTNIGVRLPSLIVSLLGLYILYLLVKEKFKDSKTALLSVLITSLSLFWLWLNIFDFSATLALTFIFLSIYFYLKNNFIGLWLSSLAVVFSSFYAILFSFVLILGFISQKSDVRKTIFMAGVLLFSLLFIFSKSRSLSNFIERKSMLKNLSFSEFSYIIDRKLLYSRFSLINLVKNDFNYSRIAHNKPFYASSELFRNVILPFDFERLISPLQSQTILTRDRADSLGLPKLFFWEVPIILVGLFSIFKKKDKLLVLIIVAGLSSVIFFGFPSLFLFIPVFIIAETHTVIKVIRMKNVLLKKATLFLIVILLTGGYLHYINELWNNKPIWIGNNNYAHYSIWNSLSIDNSSENKIVITDRLGEPVYYYLFYRKVDPKYFHKNKVLGVITGDGLQRIESVGSIEFRSFKYKESILSKNETWIGLAGEFVGENVNYDKEIILDGIISQKVGDIKTESKSLGSEVWIVKTEK